MHKFTFDLWPPDADGRTLPDRVAVTAQTPEDAQRSARADAPDGWLATLASHVRSQCEPAHPGTD